MPLAYYGSSISPNIIRTPEGAIIAKNVPIGRTGEMEYLGSELSLTDRASEIVKVVRRDDEVFSQAALASFEGKPVTDGHPPEDVNPSNWGLYSKGHVQNVRRGTGDDADKMIADLFINDATLADKVENKIKREVSSGYACMYIPMPDGRYEQKQLRGNHVAVVDEGRAGKTVAIKDEIIKKEPQPKRTRGAKKRMGKFADNKYFGVLNLLAHAVQDAQKDDIEEIVSDAAKAIESMDEAQEFPVNKAKAEAVKAGEIEAKPNANDCDYMSNADAKAMFDSFKTEIVDAVRGMMDEKAKDMPEDPQTEDEKAKDEAKNDSAKDDKEDKIEALLEDLIGHDEKPDKKEIEIEVEEKKETGDAYIVDASKDSVFSADNAVIAEIVKSVRPVIADIKNKDERRKATDALIDAVQRLTNQQPKQPYNDVLSAMIGNASNGGAFDSLENAVTKSQNAYNKLNPHLNK